jgi:hypothetical protein
VVLHPVIVTVPVLAGLPVYSVTVTVTVPFPVPDDGETVIHAELSETVQELFDVTVICLLPGNGVKLSASVETEILQVS